MFVAEGGSDNRPIHIFGRRADESVIEIYPHGTRVPFINKPFRIYGPIGGIAASNGKLFVSHRDINDMGVITAFNYDGTHSTVVSEFPAQGEYGITDIAIHPGDGRLYFGVGPATNSGVVGIDDWAEGWLKKHPNASDVSPVDLKLYGLKFTSSNPFTGVFGGGDTGVTAAFQPFNTNDKLDQAAPPTIAPTVASIQSAPAAATCARIVWHPPSARIWVPRKWLRPVRHQRRHGAARLAADQG